MKSNFAVYHPTDHRALRAFPELVKFQAPSLMMMSVSSFPSQYSFLFKPVDRHVSKPNVFILA